MAEKRRSLQRRRLGVGSLMLILPLVLLLVGCLRQGVYHQVESGQTLYRISKTYQIDEAYLARINGIPNPTLLRAGTKIFIPGATSTKYVPATIQRHNSAPQSSPPARTVVKKATPALTPAEPRPSPAISAIPAAPSKKSDKVALKLHWPLRGKILRTFGQSGNGGGKGLEIAAQDGSKVSAAAAGKVIYSGDGVQGFGHLMILQHANDVFTVYGYNSHIYVKQGQFVSQGEKIASSGRPPSGESGRLHFEVRVGKLAVDPILYLP